MSATCGESDRKTRVFTGRIFGQIQRKVFLSDIRERAGEDLDEEILVIFPLPMSPSAEIIPVEFWRENCETLHNFSRSALMDRE
ncbi:hypothetical protein [Microbulbifer guangxiensis]|uniref:hypothetical protein n=1 Tax=Microbulbifer guangxiensis TaxID=2904249 RepID=UPI001F21B99B|nr:hypothetical protein [Microbulbifer guangxiensis]